MRERLVRRLGAVGRGANTRGLVKMRGTVGGHPFRSSFVANPALPKQRGGRMHPPGFARLVAVVSCDDARELGVALPEAVEQDHHGRPPFRLAGKIFATVWDEHHLNVMLDERGIRRAVHAGPDTFAEVCWGNGSRRFA